MAGRPKKIGIKAITSRVGLERRTAPYWCYLGKGQQLGYRKGTTGGFWLARFTDLKTLKKIQESIGVADDEIEADGEEVLTFDQAANKARAWFEDLPKKAEAKLTTQSNGNVITVIEAVESYLEYLFAEKKGGKQAEQAARKYILSSSLGPIRVVDLTTTQISDFRKGIAESPRMTRVKVGKPPVKRRKTADSKDAEPRRKGKWEMEAESMSAEDLMVLRSRQRKSTSNRVLTILKSALNRLVKADPSIDDRAWRIVTPYQNADGNRTEFLEVDEQRRLVSTCPPDLRKLVLGALYTGARYGELRTMHVHQVFPEKRSILLQDSKTSNSRVIPLNQEGSRFFAELIKDRRKNDLVFIRMDGEPWGRSHTFRPLRAACDAAKINPIAFHELRHTYASHLIMAGAELTAVAKALGHKDTRMIEKHYGHLREGWVHQQIDQFSPKLFPETTEAHQTQESEAPSPSKVPPVPEKRTRRRSVVDYTAPGGPRKTWYEEPITTDDGNAGGETST